MEKKRIPKRRFREFLEAGEWKDFSFGTLVERKSTMMTGVSLPILEYEDLISGSGELDKDITQKNGNKTGIFFQEGDIVYGKLRPYLKNWYLPAFDGIAVGDFWVFRSQNIAPTFIYGLIQTPRYETVANQSIGTKMPRADWHVVSDTSFFVPMDYCEQKKIGDFCRRLDTLISLHQQKLSKLKNLKQAYLTEMFPAPGEKRPRRRFKGFSGDWKKSKFGDVVTQADIKVNPWQENVDLYSVTIEDGLIAKSDRYNRESLVKKQDIFSLVCPRQIVYNPMNMTLGSIGYNANNFDVAVSGYYTILSVNDGIDPYYFYTYMKLRNTLSVYSVYATGSLKEKQRLQFPTLVGIPCILPELEEQKKIAHVASLLDERIIKAKNSLEKLQSLKQAYLSELFV